MRLSALRFFWFLCSVGVGMSLIGLFAQSTAPVDAVENEIRVIEDLLAETEGEEKQTMADLRLLNRQIHLRQRRVANLSEEIQRMEDEIIEMDVISCQMEEDLVRLEADFKQVAQTTYLRNRTDNFWLTMLSAGNISKMYYRAIYFREFANFRKRQIEAIQNTRAYLVQKSSDYELSILRMKGLITEKAGEVNKLESSRTDQKALLANLKNQASSYQKELKLRRARLKQLIKSTEQEYISGHMASGPKGDYAKVFPNRKGLLTWPVPRKQSVLTGSFGESEDAFGNRIVNDGIYLQTAPNQAVRAVFDGTVTAVTQLPLSGAIVIIEHGDFRTVYANLNTSMVKVGDPVVKRQTIGNVRKDPRTGEAILNFLIYKIPETFLDPETWLIK